MKTLGVIIMALWSSAAWADRVDLGGDLTTVAPSTANASTSADQRGFTVESSPSLFEQRTLRMRYLNNPTYEDSGSSVIPLTGLNLALGTRVGPKLGITINSILPPVNISLGEMILSFFYYYGFIIPVDTGFISIN